MYPGGIVHNGKVFGPDGLLPVSPEDVEKYNQSLDQQHIQWIKDKKPEKLTAYVRFPKKKGEYVQVTTWIGTELGKAWLGEKVRSEFGSDSYRRAITVRIFGILYHGWYMESSGDYCRLKKAKIQMGEYAASTEVRE